MNATGATGAAGLGSLDFLRNNPQFQQLRQIVQTQPGMLEPILQQVGAGNPQLAQLIGQHPDQFLQLLSEDADEDAPLPPGAQAISVSEEEREAIERVSTISEVYPEQRSNRCSYAVLGSNATLSFKPTLPAKRMKSLQRTFYSSNLLRTMTLSLLMHSRLSTFRAFFMLACMASSRFSYNIRTTGGDSVA